MLFHVQWLIVLLLLRIYMVYEPLPFFWHSKHKQELSKFINYCNETKAATLANKEGGQLSIVKAPLDAGNSSAKKE